MPRDAVSRTANVERTGRHKWVNEYLYFKIVKKRSVRFDRNSDAANYGVQLTAVTNQKIFVPKTTRAN